MTIKAITDKDFQSEVTQYKGYVLVDFWAEWCGPCLQLSKELDKVALTMSDKIKFVKMNISDNTDTPAQMNVKSIPALFLFKNGVSISNKVGYMKENDLKDWIETEIK